jgi:hypothetical protein
MSQAEKKILIKKMNGVYWRLHSVGVGLQLEWRNALGGWHDAETRDFEEEKIFETADHELVERLRLARYVKEDVLSENLRSGWISPEGAYYSCQPNKHLDLIEFGLGLVGAEAEDKGWIKVSPKTWYLTMSRRREPTSEQKRTLKKIGRDPNLTDYVDKSITYEQAFPRGNRAMDELKAEIDKKIAEGEAKLTRVTVTYMQAYQFI